MSYHRSLGRFVDAREVFVLPFIQRYWNDPAFRARCDAETQAERDAANREYDVHRDRNALRCDVNEALETITLETLSGDSE